MSENIQDPSESSSNHLSLEGDWRPGEQLKAHREARNIQLESVAQETLIPLSKLEYLEADAYESVGRDTFVVAYIRKYAKSLNTDSDILVEQYKYISGSTLATQSLSAGQTSRATPADVPANTNSMSDFFRKLFEKVSGWQLIVALLVIWLLSVVLFRGEPEEETGAQVLDNSLESRMEVTNSLDNLGSQEIPPADNTNPAEGLADSEEQVFEPVTPVVNEQNSAPEPAIAGQDILVMSFYGECWVKVIDAKGELLFAQLQNTGDNLRLSGEAPFDVMLGNAKAVDLLVNGTRIPTEPPEGKRTLRANFGP